MAKVSSNVNENRAAFEQSLRDKAANVQEGGQLGLDLEGDHGSVSPQKPQAQQAAPGSQIQQEVQEQKKAQEKEQEKEKKAVAKKRVTQPVRASDVALEDISAPSALTPAVTPASTQELPSVINPSNVSVVETEDANFLMDEDTGEALATETVATPVRQPVWREGPHIDEVINWASAGKTNEVLGQAARSLESYPLDYRIDAARAIAYLRENNTEKAEASLRIMGKNAAKWYGLTPEEISEVEAKVRSAVPFVQSAEFVSPADLLKEETVPEEISEPSPGKEEETVEFEEGTSPGAFDDEGEVVQPIMEEEVSEEASEEEETPYRRRPSNREEYDAILDTIASDMRSGRIPSDGSDPEGLSEAYKAIYTYFGIQKGKGKDGKETEKNQKALVRRMVMRQMGYTPDTKNRIFAKKYSDGTVRDYEVISTIRQIIDNDMSDDIGFAFAYSKPSRKFASVYRFPIPVLTDAEAEFFGTARPGYVPRMNANGFKARGDAEWVQRIRPALDLRGTKDQKTVIRAIVDVVEKQRKTRHNLAGWLDHNNPQTRITIQDAYDFDTTFASLFEDPEEYRAERAEYWSRYDRAVMQHFKATHKNVKYDRDGNLTADSDPVEVNDETLGQIFLRSVRGAKLATNLVTGLFGAIESGVGSLDLAMTTQVLYKGANVIPGAKNLPAPKNRKGEALIPPSADMYQAMSDKDMRGTMKVICGMYSSGDTAKITIEATEGARFEADNRKLLEKIKTHEGKHRILTPVSRQLMAFGAAVAEGNIAWSRVDGRNYLDMVSWQMQRDTDLTAKEIHDMYMADPQGFISFTAGTEYGMQALKYASERSIGSPNIYTMKLAEMCRKNGWVKLATMILQGCFWKYNFNIIGKWFVPYSNTITYGIKHAIESRRDPDDRSHPREMDDIVLQLLPSFVLDSIRFGRGAIMVGILMAVMEAFGFDEPEDELKKFYDEYLIGGQAIHLCWGWNDMLGASYPLAVAMMAASKGYVDGAGATEIFLRGVMQNFGNHPIAEGITLINDIQHFDERSRKEHEDAVAQWGDQAPSRAEMLTMDLATFAAGRFFGLTELWLPHTAYKDDALFDPNALAPSHNMVYSKTGELNSDGTKATDPTDYIDSRVRDFTHDHELAAFLMNMLSGYYFQDEGATANIRTGYARDEAPLVTGSDAIMQAYAEAFEITDEMIADPDKAEINAKVDYALEMLTRYDSIEKLVATGFCLPYDVRSWAAGRLKAEESASYQLRQERLDALYDGPWVDDFNEQKSAIYADHQATMNRVYALREVLWSKAIPYSPTKWNLGIQDYNYDPLTGEIYGFGNRRSSINPFYTVSEDPDGAYNREPASTWDSKYLTDAAEVERVMREEVMPMLPDGVLQRGIHTGQDPLAAATVEGGTLTHPNDAYTPGLGRLWVPDETRYQVTLPTEEEKEAYAALLDPGFIPIDTLKAEAEEGTGSSGSRSSYYSRSSGGGSSSGYNPNIYSRPAYSLNADKPASMYAKTPSYTRFDYLRPGFETKGSREAYKRQDI